MLFQLKSMLQFRQFALFSPASAKRSSRKRTLTAQMKRAVRVDLEGRYGDPQLSILLDVCTYLDPQFKQAEPDPNVIEHVREELLLTLQPEPLPLPSQEKRSVPAAPRKKRFLAMILGTPEPERPSSQSPEPEIDRYHLLPTSDLETCPMEWWKV